MHQTIDQFASNATQAFSWLSSTKAGRADLLEAIAQALESQQPGILEATSDETALTEEELAPEFLRMVGTLRMCAGVIREGSWVRAAIDTARPAPTAPVGPNHDVRRMLVPNGPVAVFGASNFPLAYGVCGGDTASALAAGCPVVVKEHPAHPKTGRLIHEVAKSAIARLAPAAITDSVLGYIHNEDPRDLSIAQAIVQHPSIKGVGFTGSFSGGLAIDKLGREREERIPVFAEMGSNNVVVITGAAAQARGHDIADQLAASILQRFGQQCTRPGTIMVELGAAGTHLVERLASHIRADTGRDMLAPWVKKTYERRLKEVEACRGVRTAARGEGKPGQRGSHATLFAIDALNVDGHSVFDQEALRDEVFGPAALVVRVPVVMVGDLHLRGSLAYSIYCEPSEHSGEIAVQEALETAGHNAGRITFNGVPTGVRVAHGMVHGGPFPATNRHDTTAVGPYAMERWCRPVCFQNCPNDLLPPELQDSNPLHIFRQIDGRITNSRLGTPEQ